MCTHPYNGRSQEVKESMQSDGYIICNWGQVCHRVEEGPKGRVIVWGGDLGKSCREHV